MRWLDVLALRVRSLFRGERVDTELDAELGFHIEQLTRERIAAGMAPDAARHEALRAVGGVAQIQEECRDMRRVHLLEDTARDLRYGWRSLAHNPVFTLVAILTLALGIGANTAIFSLVRGVLLRPLDYPDANRIVALKTRWPEKNHAIPRLTGPDLTDIARDNDVFAASAPYTGGEIGVQLGDHAEFTGTYLTFGDFFRVFQAKPVAGRVFTDSEPGRPAVVSASFAERNFGGVAAALGRTLSMENRSYEIVGVLPASFHYPQPAEVWLSGQEYARNLASSSRTSYSYPVIALLKPGITVEQAQAQLETIGKRLSAAFPADNKGKTFGVTPLQEEMVGGMKSTLWFLMGAVTLVLLIACANVANLLLARATARKREMAVRAALGAARRRIARQLAVESLLLAAIGGTLGVLLAWLGTAALVRLAPDNLPRLHEVRVDPLVLLFAVAVSLLASVLFGLAPMLQAARVNLSDALKSASARGGIGGGSNRLRAGLVIAEIALSFVLATGAGLLFRSFMALNAVELGYRTEGVLVMYAHDPAATREEYIGATRFFEERLFPQLAAIPGVRSVAGAMGLPTGRYGSNGSYFIQGRDDSVNPPNAGFRLASPGYFAVMGVPLLRGRDFTARDAYDQPFVAIVSQALVRRSFPGQDPVGQRIKCGLDSSKWMTVVGVVGDVRQDSPASVPAPELYMPLRQHPYHANELQVVMRTDVEPASLTNSVRRVVQNLNPQVPVKFTTLRAMVAETTATPRFRTFLVSVFAGLALVLAMAGIYGVMAYVTARRTPEMGVRIALGATPADLFGGVIARAGALAAIGMTCGLGLAVALSHWVESMLFGLRAMDAPTYAGALVAVALVVLAAAALPAWRASRIDPVTALREE